MIRRRRFGRMVLAAAALSVAGCAHQRPIFYPSDSAFAPARPLAEPSARGPERAPAVGLEARARPAP